MVIILIILSLINLGLLLYITRIVKENEKSFMFYYNEILQNIINYNKTINKEIKNLPKEIIIKNYLKIP